MLFFSSLAIAVASILLTQVAHRRARHRASNPYRRESAYMLLLPVALVVVGLLLVAAVGAGELNGRLRHPPIVGTAPDAICAGSAPILHQK